VNDDAVAPVVAAMLILAVVVTFFVAWNANFIPSMKARSEIGHIREVETGFMHFSSDIETAASLKRDLTFSETIPLGGGAMVFDSLTSAGTLRVEEDPYPLYSITVTDNGIDYGMEGSTVNFAYQPVNNFWVDQGYVWHYGYVNVTKGISPQGADGAALSAPLTYATMDDMKKSGTIRKFAESFTAIDSRPWYNSSANCSHITLSAVKFQEEPGATYVNSNGPGTLALSATVKETGYGIPETRGPDAVIVYVNRVSPESFPFALYTQCNQSFADLEAKYPGNIVHTFLVTPDYKVSMITPVTNSLPFDVTYRQVVVNVSVH
jgi:hypothetical protein